VPLVPGVKLQEVGGRQGVRGSHICVLCAARAGGGRAVRPRPLPKPGGAARAQAGGGGRAGAHTPVHCVLSQPAVGRRSGPGLFRGAGGRRRPGGRVHICVLCDVTASGGQTVRLWPVPMRRRAAAARTAHTARCCTHSRRCTGRCCWRAARRRRTCTPSRCSVRGQG
jgi:hypothetical protein